MDRERGHLPYSVADLVSDLIWIKIVAIGNPGVGKTCIMKHYCEDKFTQSYQPTVGVDYGFKIHTVNNVEIRAHLWDLSGHSDFTEVRNELYRDTEALFLVYDVTNKASFENLDNWLREASRCGADSAFLAVVANKIWGFLYEEEKRTCNGNGTFTHQFLRRQSKDEGPIHCRPGDSTSLKAIGDNFQLHSEDEEIYIVFLQTDLKSKRVITTEEGSKWAAARRIRYLETSASSGEGIQTLFTELLTAAVKRHIIEDAK